MFVHGYIMGAEHGDTEFTVTYKRRRFKSMNGFVKNPHVDEEKLVEYSSKYVTRLMKEIIAKKGATTVSVLL